MTKLIKRKGSNRWMIIKLYDEERVDEITASLMELGVRYKMEKEMDKREMNTVIYVASQGHKLEMHIQKEKKREIRVVREKLDDLEKRLNRSNYLRVHKSFLVNSDYIQNICRYEVLLSGGKKIPISKSRYKEVQEWWKKQQKR